MKKEDPKITELRKQGKWPFPLWQNGRIVVFKVKKVKKDLHLEFGDALM